LSKLITLLRYSQTTLSFRRNSQEQQESCPQGLMRLPISRKEEADSRLKLASQRDA
jgi:hypothetical protein